MFPFHPKKVSAEKISIISERAIRAQKVSIFETLGEREAYWLRKRRRRALKSIKIRLSERGMKQVVKVAKEAISLLGPSALTDQMTNGISQIIKVMNILKMMKRRMRKLFSMSSTINLNSKS